jgi:hypothetical protein
MTSRRFSGFMRAAMTTTFTVSETERTGVGQGERLDEESRDAANAQDMAKPTLIPQDAWILSHGRAKVWMMEHECEKFERPASP